MEASKLGDKLRLGGLPRPPSCKIGWKQHTGQNGNSISQIDIEGGGDEKGIENDAG